MVDNKLRDYLLYELELKSAIFENPSYDGSIIGITNDQKLVYSYPDMIGELMEDDGMTVDDAIEFIDYNTMRVLPYIDEDIRPIVMYPLDGEY